MQDNKKGVPLTTQQKSDLFDNLVEIVSSSDRAVTRFDGIDGGCLHLHYYAMTEAKLADAIPRMIEEINAYKAAQKPTERVWSKKANRYVLKLDNA